eukprot:5528184-Pleurochrysis_carterae.AAC.1
MQKCDSCFAQSCRARDSGNISRCQRGQRRSLCIGTFVVITGRAQRPWPWRRTIPIAVRLRTAREPPKKPEEGGRRC